ncbi:SET and MYND domain-containing protein DDB_G0273589-like [Culicoides brevitarsis]|uniref:SET and MYND domain-containing protein DDB_G0273589-like n=1 Tax=Culicoides brevitarsis TaxID=469753 RepID=UPI00307C6893
MNVNKLPYKLKLYLGLVNDRAVMERFSRLSSPQEKVDMCLDLLKEAQVEDLIAERDVGKCEEKAKVAYTKAMEHLEKESFDEALIALNESLCFAPNNSSLLAKIYTHRAKIYFNMKLLEACMENVNWATEYGAGNDATLELEKIRTKCINAVVSGAPVKEKEEFSVEPKLSYPSHENIPFIANSIQLNMNKIYGRHLVANRDLSPGDVIMVEKPFAPVIEPKAAYQKCNNCLSFAFYNLIPCPTCVGAMFCSQQCYQRSCERSHNHECLIMEKLQKWFTDESLVGFKLILLALHAFPDLDELNALQETMNSTMENQFTFDFKNANEYTIFKTICSLTTIENDRNTEDLFKKTQIAAVMYDLLLQDEKLRQKLVQGSHESLIKKLLYQFLQTTTINTFLMWSQREMTSARQPDHSISDFGIASYPLSSFLSHSCAPNVRKARAGKNHEIMLIFVVRPIKAGDKICDCYDQQNNHMVRGLEERRACLYDQYYFMCQCEACVNDYPSKAELKKKLRESEWEQMKEAIKFCEVDANENSTVNKNFEHLCTFLTDYDSFYPCEEIVEAQSYLHEFMRHFYTKPQFTYE